MGKETYISGICNIGPQERKLRRMGGWVGVAVSIALLFYFHLAHTSGWINILIFFPALVGSIGLIQYYAHFCVNYGLRGLFNVDKEASQTDRVENVEFRAKDRQKSLLLILLGVVISFSVAVIAYFL